MDLGQVGKLGDSVVQLQALVSLGRCIHVTVAGGPRQPPLGLVMTSSREHLGGNQVKESWGFQLR